MASTEVEEYDGQERLIDKLPVLRDEKDENKALRWIVMATFAAVIGMVVVYAVAYIMNKRSETVDEKKKQKESEMTPEERKAKFDQMLQQQRSNPFERVGPGSLMNASAGGNGPVTPLEIEALNFSPLQASTSQTTARSSEQDVINANKEIFKAFCSGKNEVLPDPVEGKGIHCYAPCPEGFEAINVEPNAENEELFDIALGTSVDPSVSPVDRGADGKPLRVAYRACRAKCPIDKNGNPTDTGGGKNSCTREWAFARSDYLGKGWQTVKCGWSSGKYSGHYRSTDNHDCGDKDKTPDCAKGKMEALWPSEKDGKNPIASHLCSEWGHGATGPQTKVWTMYSPAACSGDYELLPSRKVAYIDRNLEAGKTGSVPEGGNPPAGTVGMFCYKMCPAGSTAIPSGEKEVTGSKKGQGNICASPCPINTKVNENDSTSCIKDGFKRPIVMMNMQELLPSQL